MYRLVLAASAIVLYAGCGSAQRNAGPTSPGAPHTAHVDAAVMQCTEEARFLVCGLRIEHVHEIGAAVPALRNGSEIDARIYRSQLQDEARVSTGRRVELSLHALHPAGSEEPLWFVEILH